MINILVISYYFPPEGGPAVQRVTKFVKYLPENGVNPIVLTSKHPIKTHDTDLLSELGKNLMIYRIIDFSAYIPGDIYKLLRFIFFPDKQMLWAKIAAYKAKALIKKHDIKLILTSSPPHSIQQIAFGLSKQLKIPYIADFRDEWSANPDFYSWNKPLKQVNIEKMILKQAKHIISISEGAVHRFMKLAEQNNVSVIYNGFDPIDFAFVMKKTISESYITFAYGGRLSESHSPQTFLAALNQLIIEKAVNPDKIKIAFWGNNTNRWLKNCELLHDIVKFTEYLPHKEYIKAISNADVLLLFVTKIKDSDIITGKVFEYMYFNKPILAIVEKDCELNQILNEYGNAYICYHNDIEGTKKALIDIVNTWEKKEPGKKVNLAYINQFDRKRQTKQLAEIIKKSIE